MRGRLRVVGGALLVSLVVAGCGGVRNVADDPEQAVRDALERMSGWEGISVTLRLDAEVDDLLAADEHGQLTQLQAQAFLDGRATIRSYAGADLADRSDDEGEVLVETGGTTLLHVMAVGTEQLFVRAEVREAVDRFADAQVAAELDAAELQAAQFGIDFAGEFFAGAWLSLRGAEEVSNLYGAVVGMKTPEPEEIESFLAELQGAVEQLLEEARVEHLGAEDAGEHVRIVATGQQLGELSIRVLEGASTLVAGQVGLPPGMLADELRAELSRAPRIDVPIELWLRDGVVGQVGFDVVEFARRNGDAAEIDVPAEVDRFLFLAELEEFDGGLSTPGDAIDVDLSELMGRFMGYGFDGFDPADGP